MPELPEVESLRRDLAATLVGRTFAEIEVRLAKQVIETFAAPLNLADYKDEYREGLQKIIDAKIAGEEIVAPTLDAPPKVVNLMEALKRSLDTVSTTKKKPAKAAVARAEKAAPKRKRA